jgi:aminoglycoside phosphotransferase (APT) family kinase protein
VTPDPLLDSLRRDLSRALRSGAPGHTLGDLQLVSGGRSAVTAVADLSGPGGATERVAVRALARGAADLAVGTLGDQFALLELLRSEPVLAPRPVLLAEELEGTDHDLLVTAYVAGRVPQPWRRAGREEIAVLRAGGRFRDDFVETLARIHQVGAERLPPGLAHEGADSAATHSGRARDRCVRSFGASGGFAEDPVLTYCLLWLEAHAPSSTFASGLVHGDYRLGNLVVDPDGRLCGVLDWELAEAGETLSDVAWLCGPQGAVDGHAAGLFAPEELVTRYERVTGRAVDGDLFAHLRVEGTLRTAAVWAQLSVVEMERGEPALALRCQESVLELIGLCARSLGLPTAPTAGAARGSDLHAGIAAVSERLGLALSAESRTAGTTQPPAARHTASFLHRLAGLLAGDEYVRYAADCRAVVAASATDLPPDLPPGVALSRLLHRLDIDDAEVRRLVAWSAAPPIALANLLAATGAGRTR